MKPSGPEDKDVILKYFESSQQDFRQRVELKQSVLVAYAGATAALLAFIIQQGAVHPNVVYLLFVVPMFSLLAASNFADHMLATTGIASYQINELQPRLSSILIAPPMLHESKHLKPLKSIFWMLQLGELILIALPSFGSLVLSGIFVGQRWTSLTVVARYGLPTALLVDCICFGLSLMLLRKIAKNTEVFVSSSRKTTSKTSAY